MRVSDVHAEIITQIWREKEVLAASHWPRVAAAVRELSARIVPEARCVLRIGVAEWL
jgi:hypothetical protein